MYDAIIFIIILNDTLINILFKILTKENKEKLSIHVIILNWTKNIAPLLEIFRMRWLARHWIIVIAYIHLKFEDIIRCM